MAIRLARAGYKPVSAVALHSLHRQTMLRKLSQWGLRDSIYYARTKLIPSRNNSQADIWNPYLEALLKPGKKPFRNLRDVGASHGFPVALSQNQNSADSIEYLRKWSADLIIFTGGDILRRSLLDVPRLGVLNLHLGMLPEIRGMSSPEWSLLNNVPLGVTIHYMDTGIDTGPILQRCELPNAARCDSLGDLRHRLVAFGIEKMADIVAAIDRGTISASPQPALLNDRQFFVMHEWLRIRAAKKFMRAPSLVMREDAEPVGR